MSTDYTQTDLMFKARKAARYTRIYGVLRTLAKIKGQYHMRATNVFEGSKWENMSCRDPDARNRNVAIIGCGNYAYSVIAYYLAKHDRKFLRCTYDILRNRSLSLCKAYGGSYAVANWNEILNDTKIETVFIASNHASHAEYAIACINAGKHVHIEKPPAVTQNQLARLVAAMRNNPKCKVFLGFNRPRSGLVAHVQRLLKLERGPLMINWFIAGHEIGDDHWYFGENEGGRVLGNLCHWTDLTLHLVTLEKALPCTIKSSTPIGSKSDFVFSVVFADQSCASITFSAKGHLFEGVKEVLNLHKGNLLLNVTDFECLSADYGERKIRRKLFHRDHGHEANIVNSILNARSSDKSGEPIEYVEATGRLALAVKQAIDTGETVVVS